MANRYYKKQVAAVSKEEKKYHEALELLHSVDCVLRFEWRVKSLEDASRLFAALGEYKDAKEQARFCEKRAREIQLSGYEEVFQDSLRKKQEAVSKSDFADAIVNFKRVLGSERHEAVAREQIAACKKEIARIETKLVWKKRGIAFLVICLLGFLFYLSPAYSYTRGYILQRQGRYEKALQRYRAAAAFPLTDRQVGKCHLEIGKKYLAKGKKEKALREFWKAGNEKEAQELAAGLEKERIKNAETGKILRFGMIRWQVLKNDGVHVLLISAVKGKKHIYYKEENKGYLDSHIRRWLNGSYKKARFSAYERKLLEGIDQMATGKKIKLFRVSMLSETEYAEYRTILEPVKFPFWLKDERQGGRNVSCVEISGETGEADGSKEVCYARPVICVKVD